MTEISAWYDDQKRADILNDSMDIYFYMIYATHAEERKKWLHAFFKRNPISFDKFTNEIKEAVEQSE
jgi:hypothetical protein